MKFYDNTEANGKLKSDVKTEWLTLLRSGDVEQATGALRRLESIDENGNQTFGYCCLGVLSDIYVKRNTTDGMNGETDNPIRWDAPDRVVSGMSCDLVTPGGIADGMPTHAVSDWAFAAGSSNGWYVYIDEADAKKYERYLSSVNGEANCLYLPQMNDAGVPFTTIADIIEKYL